MASINGYGIFHLLKYESSWLLSWHFITGIILFLTGFIINKTADEKLRHYEKEIVLKNMFSPIGWLFEYISCPHYFGEIIEWLGWAVMTWSLPWSRIFSYLPLPIFFQEELIHTVCTGKSFEDYPVKRKAVIPFII